MPSDGAFTGVHAPLGPESNGGNWPWNSVRTEFRLQLAGTPYIFTTILPKKARLRATTACFTAYENPCSS